LAEKGNKNDNLKGLIQGNLSAIYCEQLLMEEAIAAGKNAAGMCKKAQNYKNEIRAFLLVGNCFLMIEKTDSAFYYYNKCLELADFHRLDREKVNIRQSLGVTYREMKEYKKAKESLFDAISISVGDSVEKARTLMSLAKVYRLEKQMDSARFYIQQSLNLKAKEPALSMSTYALLSKIEEDSDHHKEALKYYKEYANYVVKLVEENKSNALLELQGKYDFETLKNDKRQSALANQKILTATFFTLLLVGLLAFVFYRKSVQNWRATTEANQIIESLRKMMAGFSKEKDSFRHHLLRQFNILHKVALINQSINEDDRKKGERLIKKINQIVYEQDQLDWDYLYQVMNQLKDGFYDQIRHRYPQLSETEFRICCLSCEKFDDSDIAVLLNTTHHMIQKKRSSIRKKLGVPHHGNLYAFFCDNLEKNTD
jgi:tetratricopeptide (TPR) repeat protein